VIDITHFSTFEGGGAGRAAYRIHRSLVDHGAPLQLNSRLRVIHGSSDDPTVTAGEAQGQNWLWRRLRPRLASRTPSRFDDGNPVLHSTCWPDSGLGRELAQSDAQIVHLHWIGRAGLSIEEVGRLPQSLVWTLHDQWAFCGSEHYVRLPPAVDQRFVQGYQRSNRPRHERGPDLNRSTWIRKTSCWRRPIHIVCPSRWLAADARASSLMRHWPVRVIPYPIDVALWAPVDQSQARHELGLPLGVPLILFAAMSGTADLRKGSDLLLEALHQLPVCSRHGSEPPQLVIVGSDGHGSTMQYPFPVHFRGLISDNQLLRLHYAAADVMVIPSRQDNLPNTGLEAQACGLPVVGFRIGGLPDIAADRISGALAEPFDPGSLAEAIAWVLADRERQAQLAHAARERAVHEWDPARIARLYADLYREVLDSPRADDAAVLR
jgi:glycosyltransferase involved in cell wall biosynthesis